MINSTIPKNENTRVILRMAASVGATSILALSGCTTMIDPYGQPQSALTPQGAAIVKTLVNAGAGSGTLLKNQPRQINRMINSLVSDLTRQHANNYNYRPQSGGYDRSYGHNYSYQRQLPQMPITNQYVGEYNNRNAYNNRYNANTSGIYKPNPIYRQQRLNQKYNQRYNQNMLYQRLPNGEFVPVSY